VVRDAGLQGAAAMGVRFQTPHGGQARGRRTRTWSRGRQS
jgi:hypothetical protein